MTECFLVLMTVNCVNDCTPPPMFLSVNDCKTVGVNDSKLNVS